MPATGAGQVFLNVQILRGIAAIMVVLYHVGGGLRFAIDHLAKNGST